jgi:hypothetical protein
MNTTIEKCVYTVQDVQLLLGIGKNQAYELIKSEAFPTRKVGKKIIISKQVFDHWLNFGNFIKL